jgi:AhpD family alkylhydroperoxidase
MANALANVAWESCLFEPKVDREMERYARRRLGVPSMTVRYFAAVPWVARVVVDLHPEFGLMMRLDPHTADLIGLIVSQENACRFCFAVVHASLWFQGMDQERIRRIERDLSQADLSPRTRAAIDYARAQSRTGPAGARQAWGALRAAGFDAQERKEIAFTVALTEVANRVSTIAAVPVLPMERLPEQLATRLLRPLLGWLTGRRRVRGVAVAAPAIDLPSPTAGWWQRLPARRSPRRLRTLLVVAAPYAALQAADLRRRLARPAVRRVRTRDQPRAGARGAGRDDAGAGARPSGRARAERRRARASAFCTRDAVVRACETAAPGAHVARRADA